MRKGILWASAVLMLASCGPQPDFHVDISLVDEEHSEDSNSLSETVTIDGYYGTYYWVYDGYHPDDDFDTDKKYSFLLNDAELQELTLLIRENGLMVSREATVSTGEPWSAFDLTWNNSMEGQSATGHVVGQPISWDDYHQNGEQMATDESYYAAAEVMSFVREKVEFEY